MKAPTKKLEEPEAAPETPSAPLTDEVAPPEKSADSVAEMVSKKEPNEAFFGSILLFCLVLSLIAATGYFGYAGYRYYKQTQAERAIPSIESLPRAEMPAVTEDKKSESTEKPVAQVPTEPSSAVDKKTLVIKVLNGGSAKGVAGTYAEKLKAAGFTKTTVGNSFANYAGQTLFYAKGQESGSKALKDEIMKAYPALITKEAPAGDKDAAAATFVLILGR
ncbi:MAG: LytR C-terminal domain-containing protein [Candidatus Moraniibacteriota bacterium]